MVNLEFVVISRCRKCSVSICNVLPNCFSIESINISFIAKYTIKKGLVFILFSGKYELAIFVGLPNDVLQSLVLNVGLDLDNSSY